MRVCVSGSIASGKTTIAKRISKALNLKYIDVNRTIEKYKISEGYDKKRKCKIVDVNKLLKFLIKIISKEKNVVIDSHLSHYLPKKFVDFCIVTKCDIKVLKKRLEKRGYNKEKIRENLDAEIFEVCLQEAIEKKHNIIVVDTTKKVIIKDLIKKLK